VDGPDRVATDLRLTGPAAGPDRWPLEERWGPLLRCPACGDTLAREHDPPALRCAGGRHRFASPEGIPQLFWPTEESGGRDVTEVVRAFYEDTPFPNYDDIDSPETLRVKAEAGAFAASLSEEIPHGALVLEAGCGTGQLSNFLGLRWGRTVVGTDICLNSLRLAEAFRARHAIANVAFLQQNLFRPAFPPETFDVVISNGVLHHTGDPRRGFRTLVGLLRPGGHILVGLYNRLGRLTTHLRRAVFRATGDRLTFLDPRLRRAALNQARRRAWYRDQYRHPHESAHSLDEVLGWLDQSDVEFVSSIPSCVAGAAYSPTQRLFAPRSRGTSFDRLLAQVGLLLKGGPEGGFFILIGRKRAAGSPPRPEEAAWRS
jgi:SAM-dependent methyltransferase